MDDSCILDWSLGRCAGFHSFRFDGVYADKPRISFLHSLLLSGREVARPQNEAVGEETHHDRG